MSKNQACSKCGQDVAGYASPISVSAAHPCIPQIVCSRCAAEQTAAILHSVEDVDRFIAQTTDQLEVLEKLISMFPTMSGVTKEVGTFAMSPITVYHALQYQIAALNSRRMTLITEIGSDERIRYEIRLAINDENFELAAKLQKQFAARKDGDSPESA